MRRSFSPGPSSFLRNHPKSNRVLPVSVPSISTPPPPSLPFSTSACTCSPYSNHQHHRPSNRSDNFRPPSNRYDNFHPPSNRSGNFRSPSNRSEKPRPPSNTTQFRSPSYPSTDSHPYNPRNVYPGNPRYERFKDPSGEASAYSSRTGAIGSNIRRLDNDGGRRGGSGIRTPGKIGGLGSKSVGPPPPVFRNFPTQLSIRKGDMISSQQPSSIPADRIDSFGKMISEQISNIPETGSIQAHSDEVFTEERLIKMIKNELREKWDGSEADGKGSGPSEGVRGLLRGLGMRDGDWEWKKRDRENKERVLDLQEKKWEEEMRARERAQQLSSLGVQVSSKKVENSMTPGSEETSAISSSQSPSSDKTPTSSASTTTSEHSSSSPPPMPQRPPRREVYYATAAFDPEVLPSDETSIEIDAKDPGLILARQFVVEMLGELATAKQGKVEGKEDGKMGQVAGWDLDFLATALECEGSIALSRAISSRFLTWCLTPRGQPTLDSHVSSTLEHNVSKSPCAEIAPHLLDHVLALRTLTDMSRPQDTMFLNARRWVRHIHLHIGPTNSGKTHHALVALENARTGSYSGPLRLLAMEIWNRLLKGNVSEKKKNPPLIHPAKMLEESNNPQAKPYLDRIGPFGRISNLKTGDDRRTLDPMSGMWCSTVEMSNLEQHYDVAVVDEIQMMGDAERGSSWTGGLMGLQTDELHLCGDESSEHVIKSIVEDCGDLCTVHRYKRLSPLYIAGQPGSDLGSLNGDLTNIRPGDCVVAFTRKGLFWLKKQIEIKTGLRVGIVYGGLPPEVRENQAKLFNEGYYDCLVGSDALGMGLNLKIKRIIFESVAKFHRNSFSPISPSQMKQIAGRAGRYGLHGKTNKPNSPTAVPDTADVDTGVGEVTTLYSKDLPYLAWAMAHPIQPLKRVTISPSTNMIQKLRSIIPSKSIADSIHIFRQVANLPQFAYLADTHEKQSRILSIEHLEGMSLEEVHTWGMVPGRSGKRDGRQMEDTIISWATEQSNGNRVSVLETARKEDTLQLLESLEEGMRQHKQIHGEAVVSSEDSSTTAAQDEKTLENASKEPIGRPILDPDQLRRLEMLHELSSVYRWLNFKFPATFCNPEEAQDLGTRVQAGMTWVLANAKARQRRENKNMKMGLSRRGAEKPRRREW